MTLLCWSLKNETLSLDERSRLAVSGDDLANCLIELSRPANADWIQELVLVSTCQRFELYLVTEHPDQVLLQLREWARQRAGIISADLYQDDLAAHHLFEVAAGLDSLTLGETEISGQLRRAWEASQALGLSQSLLNGLFRHALATGRQIRQRTGITLGAQSLESLAIETLAESLGRPVSELRWLVLGAGQLGQAALRQLSHRRAEQVRVVNRSPRKGCRYLVEAWEQLAGALSWADAVLVCTGASQPVLTQANWPERNQACALADLSLPCNVDEVLRQQPGVALWQLAELHQLLEHQQQRRGSCLGPARAQLESCWQNYLDWRRERELAPMLAEIYAQVSLVPGDARRLRQQLHPLVMDLKQAGDACARQSCRQRLNGLLEQALLPV